MPDVFGTVWMVWVLKKVLVALFPYIFDVETKLNIYGLWILKKQKSFQRDTNILSQMHWASHILVPQLQPMGSFGYH